MTVTQEQYPNHDQKISLLNIYASQVGSYTTMLWQVPALSLTAQSFLLTIALTHDSAEAARYIASALSIGIALASFQLMHDQRARAICHAALASHLSKCLDLDRELLPDGIQDDDARPGLGKGIQKVTQHLVQAHQNGAETKAGGQQPEDRKWPNAVTIWQKDRGIYGVWKFLILAFAVADILIIFLTAFGHRLG